MGKVSWGESAKEERVGKVRFGDERADAGREAEMKAEAVEKIEAWPWHKAKKGTLFPAKRRSVKKMMCAFVFESIAYKGSKMPPLAVSPPTITNNNKNSVSVYPCPCP